MAMQDFFFSYWWLLFPLAFFLLSAWGGWLSYQRRKAELDVLKSYVSQGKDPPPEVARAMGGADPADPTHPYGPYGHPYYGGWWGYRRWRYGPFWEWRRAIVFGSISFGFWMASRYYPSHAFEIVAIITGVIAAASLAWALISSLFPPPK
jgi:hypothetical protein